MEIIKPGNPSKVESIKKAREKALHPKIECPQCEAQFQISSHDVQVASTGQKFIYCPCCESKHVLKATEIPSDFQEKVLDWNRGRDTLPPVLPVLPTQPYPTNPYAPPPDWAPPWDPYKITCETKDK